jgi:hypothetical protein
MKHPETHHQIGETRAKRKGRHVAQEEQPAAHIAQVSSSDEYCLREVDQDNLAAAVRQVVAPASDPTPEIGYSRIRERVEVDEIEVLAELRLVLWEDGSEAGPLIAERGLDGGGYRRGARTSLATSEQTFSHRRRAILRG